MTLATICNAVAVRAGVSGSGAWAGNPDPTAREIVEMVAEATAMITQEFDWEVLLRTHSAALNANVAQTVALPADFERMLPGTMWIDATLWPVTGPVTEAEFEMRRNNLGGLGTRPIFRVAGGAVDILAVPPPGGVLTFRYVIGTPIRSAAGEPREAWVADTDTALINERLIILGAVALWRDSKGLPAEVAMQQYNLAMSRAKAADRPIGVMSMGGTRCDGFGDVGVIAVGGGGGSGGGGGVTPPPAIVGALALSGGGSLLLAGAGYLALSGG